MHLNLMAPINHTGYGVTGKNIFKHLLRRDVNVTLFPIGNVSVETQEDAFLLQECIDKQNSDFNPEAPCLKIWHEHSLADHVGKGKYFGFPIFELDNFDYRRIQHLNCCDHIITTSKWASEIVKPHVDCSVSVAPLGVDRSIFNPEKYKDNNKPPFFTFLNCGKWEVRKGHDIILNAFQKAFPDSNEKVRLVMMCSNNFPNAQDQVKSFEQMYKGDPRCILVPSVGKHEEVASLMSQVNCGVFPSRAEGWNLELLEMMSMGKEVIATNYSAHTEYVNSENCHLIDIEDVTPAFDGVWFDGKIGNWAKITNKEIDQLASLMRECYENPRENYRGIETAQEFTWDKTVDKIINIIKE